jgi:hypothetical protein
MNPQDFQTFTEVLVANLETDERVLGLIAAGSMAGVSHQPDEWSDHDFWLVVTPGSADWYVQNTAWMPASDEIALYFQEHHGGLKTVYRSGHLLEFAVTDRAALANFRVNDYRLLIDRDDLDAELQRLQQATEREFQQVTRHDVPLYGQFLTNLLVGVGRYQRGEQMSARQLITISSLYALLRLIARHIPADGLDQLDNLDPFRRFELVYPAIGAEINTLLQRDLVACATGLLELADRLLRDSMVDYPTQAVATVRAYIQAHGS